MTDEEMARAYIIEIYDLRKDLELWRIKRDNEWRMVFNAFLAGLKAGKDIAETDLATIAYIQGAERYKPKWHKVADGDLPPLGKDCVRASIKVLDDYRRVIAYDYERECWRDCMGNPLDLQPRYWCEIPICVEE